MNKPIFSRLIKCPYCNGNYKARTERGIRRYVCSKYDNYRQCKRISVDETYLIELIENRYSRSLSREEIREIIDHIEVFDKWKYKGEDVYKLTIHFKNDEPIILGDKYFQF